MFQSQNYQEAYIIYQDLLNEDEAVSPAMLLKMAFVAEGTGDYSKASFYLAKYYDQNPNPRVITKIKVLTEQTDLMGYELNDRDRFFKFLTDLQTEITSVFTLFLVISLIVLIVLRKKANKPRYYLPSLFLAVLAFMSNNFLHGPKTAIVTGSPTLIMNAPTAASELLSTVDPGHRVTVKSSKDIWYEVTWAGKKAYIKKENVTKL